MVAPASWRRCLRWCLRGGLGAVGAGLTWSIWEAQDYAAVERIPSPRGQDCNDGDNACNDGGGCATTDGELSAMLRRFGRPPPKKPLPLSMLRYNADSYCVDLPEDVSAVLIHEIVAEQCHDSTAANMRDGGHHRHGAGATEVYAMLGLLNSVAFRFELCVAALVYGGALEAVRCASRTTTAACAKAAPKMCADAVRANYGGGDVIEEGCGRPVPVTLAKYGAWEVQLPVTPALPSPSPSSSSSCMSSGILHLSFAPLEGSRCIDTAALDDCDAVQLEAMTGRFVVRACHYCRRGGGADDTRSVQASRWTGRAAGSVGASSACDPLNGCCRPIVALVFEHFLYPWNYFEADSNVERFVLGVHDVFCRVIVAQMRRSIGRVVRIAGDHSRSAGADCPSRES